MKFCSHVYDPSYASLRGRIGFTFESRQGPGFDEDSLKKICRDLSLSRIKTHSCIDEITVVETEDFGKKDDVGQWLSLIFVSSL